MNPTPKGRMWELDYKESWAPKNWCFWTVVLEKTLESPLDCKDIQAVHPKGNESWIFMGWTDVEAETPILGRPDAENWLILKTLMQGNTEGRRKRGQPRTRWLDGITNSMGMSLSKLWELVCCSPWGHKESDTTGWLNWHWKVLWPHLANLQSKYQKLPTISKSLHSISDQSLCIYFRIQRIPRTLGAIVMPDSQSKLTRHAENWESPTHNERNGAINVMWASRLERKKKNCLYLQTCTPIQKIWWSLQKND